MEVVYQRYAGVDVHRYFFVVCLSIVESSSIRENEDQGDFLEKNKLAQCYKERLQLSGSKLRVYSRSNEQDGNPVRE
jgi:hypothetical protein